MDTLLTWLHTGGGGGNSDGTSDSDDSSTGGIVGGIIGGFAAGFVIVVSFVVVCHSKRRKGIRKV